MKYFTFAFLSAALLVVSPLPATAQSAGVQVAKKNCTCRFMGNKFQLGVMLCLKTPDGPRMARCELNLNNTTWKATSAPCHIAMTPKPQTKQSLRRFANNFAL